MLEERVSRSLHTLGVPMQKDIRDLTRRVEELSKAVAALSGKKLPASGMEAKASARTRAVKPVRAQKGAVKTPARKASSKTAARAH